MTTWEITGYPNVIESVTAFTAIEAVNKYKDSEAYNSDAYHLSVHKVIEDRGKTDRTHAMEVQIIDEKICYAVWTSAGWDFKVSHYETATEETIKCLEEVKFAIQHEDGSFYTPDGGFSSLESNADLFDTEEEAQRVIDDFGFPKKFEVVPVEVS